MRVRTRRFQIAAGGELVYATRDWEDSLVVIESGSVELETTSGARRTFSKGSTVWFEGLPIRVLRNRGATAAVLRASARALAAG